MLLALNPLPQLQKQTMARKPGALVITAICAGTDGHILMAICYSTFTAFVDRLCDTHLREDGFNLTLNLRGVD